jgi:nicotinamide mononucleotide (NMN) deamidase PncC
MERGLVRRLHGSVHQGVIVVAGGGSLLLADLLTRPGASATVLEARVPYHPRALAEFLGAPPEQAASLATARAMAMAAFARARSLVPDATHPFGLATTASLATNRDKRGNHRVHVALQTLAASRSFSLALEKGARSRLAEERVTRDLGAYALALLLNESPTVPGALRADERIEAHATIAPPAWQDLLSGRIAAVAEPQSASWPRALLPGAFDPLHDGHRAMARHAARRLGHGVAFELCIRNVDKPPLDYVSIAERLARFEADAPVWLTRAPTFVEKARTFPGVTFVLGTDTLVRIADPRYYGADRDGRDQAIAEMRELGVTFLVFGRRTGARFGVPEAEFRDDVSSTALRGRGSRHEPGGSPPA